MLGIWMVQKLTSETHTIRRKMMELSNRLTKHQKYASRLGGSNIMGMSNVAGLAPEIMPRAVLFAQYSDQASSMSAMQQLQTMKMMGQVPITGNPMTQMQLEMSAFNRFKQESLKAMKEQEVAAMSEVEKEIELEMNQLEHQLKYKEKQLETYKGVAEKEAEKAVPKL